ncbi:hypothetical protein [Changpingibacter yushuensis]|uniref:hypothetical protein n=1 Tax=Changpingibacter yushuensis TaxID=2758440 RepID=UPI0015F67F20|nr:hypothetical protein [Changpingibacter yushuensis]
MNLPDNTLPPWMQAISVRPLDTGRVYVAHGHTPPTGFWSCLRTREETLGVLSVLTAHPRDAIDDLIADGQLLEITTTTDLRILTTCTISAETAYSARGGPIPVHLTHRALAALTRRQGSPGDFGDLDALIRNGCLHVR